MRMLLQCHKDNVETSNHIPWLIVIRASDTTCKSRSNTRLTFKQSHPNTNGIGKSTAAASVTASIRRRWDHRTGQVADQHLPLLLCRCLLLCLGECCPAFPRLRSWLLVRQFVFQFHGRCLPQRQHQLHILDAWYVVLQVIDDQRMGPGLLAIMDVFFLPDHVHVWYADCCHCFRTRSWSLWPEASHHDRILGRNPFRFLWCFCKQHTAFLCCKIPDGLWADCQIHHWIHTGYAFLGS